MLQNCDTPVRARGVSLRDTAPAGHAGARGASAGAFGYDAADARPVGARDGDFLRPVALLAFNADALDRERRGAILDQLAPALGERGKVRLLMHSIAFGNLKLVAPEAKREETARAALAAALGLADARLGEAG